MLKIARKQNYENIELIHMNGEILKFKESFFDYIIISHVIAVVDNPEKLLEEAYRVLKKGNLIIFLIILHQIIG